MRNNTGIDGGVGRVGGCRNVHSTVSDIGGLKDEIVLLLGLVY